jgi:FkbH-like protein
MPDLPTTAAIDQALDDHAWSKAGELLERLFAIQPNLANAQIALSRLDRIPGREARQSRRVRILRSFVVEPLVPLLRAGARLRGLDLSIDVGPFNTYAQDLLDPASDVYTTDPDLVILAVQGRDLVPDLWHRFTDLTPADVTSTIERTLADLAGWLEAFRRHSQVPLIMPTLDRPVWPHAGALDAQGATGQTAAFDDLNRGIRHLAQQQSGIYVLDYDALIATQGRQRWYDERKWLAMRMPLAADSLAALANAYLRLLLPLAGLSCKALVVDLDNTLWGGILGEDGADGLQVGTEYPGAAFLALQQALLDLHHRGILLAIASKNDESDALATLERHPNLRLRPHHFSAWRINWNNKAQSLREIAAELNIGIDSLAFLDDNPAERALIRQELPEVRVIDLPDDPIGYAEAVRREPAFDRLVLVDEDSERSRFYQEARQRQALQASSGTLEDFLRSLGMRAEISLVDGPTIGRVAQLTQKTNQFNLTTRRYGEPEIVARVTDPAWRIYTLRLRDRFGDNGLVGVAIVHAGTTTWEIDTFLLSCRVIGRTAETTLLAHLASAAQAAGARDLQGWFRPTAKNDPASQFYPSHGFTIVRTADDDTLWQFDLQHGTIKAPPWIDCLVTENHTHR